MTAERFVGATLIFAIVTMAINEAMDSIIAHPSWLGLWLAASSITVGALAVRSIYRDRVR